MLKVSDLCPNEPILLLWDGPTAYSPCDAGGDIVLPQVVVTMANEVFTHILHFAPSKCSAVVEPAIQHASLASQQLNQLSHLWEGSNSSEYLPVAQGFSLPISLWLRSSNGCETTAITIVIN